jgi:hypothetical protein
MPLAFNSFDEQALDRHVSLTEAFSIHESVRGFDLTHSIDFKVFVSHCVSPFRYSQTIRTAMVILRTLFNVISTNFCVIYIGILIGLDVVIHYILPLYVIGTKIVSELMLQ